MSTTIVTIFNEICDDLSTLYAQPEAASIAWELMSFVTQYSKRQLLTQTLELSDIHRVMIQEFVTMHMHQHVPLAYLIQRVQFGELTLRIKPPLLIPRSETEAWCYKLIERLQPLKEKPLRILDLCTGSGCVALALAHAFPQATIIGVDISSEALDIAAENSIRNNITNCTWIQSDLFNKLDTHIFDIIVANPPYISYAEWCTLDPSVKNFESPDALIAPDEGYMIIEKIIAQASLFLTSKKLLTLHRIPQLYIEIGHNQKKRVEAFMKQCNYVNIESWEDCHKHSRVLCGTVSDGMYTKNTA